MKFFLNILFGLIVSSNAFISPSNKIKIYSRYFKIKHSKINRCYYKRKILPKDSIYSYNYNEDIFVTTLNIIIQNDINSNLDTESFTKFLSLLKENQNKKKGDNKIVLLYLIYRYCIIPTVIHFAIKCSLYELNKFGKLIIHYIFLIFNINVS